MEDDLHLWTTFCGRGTSVEDDLCWKTTFGGGQPLVEGNLWLALLSSATLRFSNWHLKYWDPKNFFGSKLYRVSDWVRGQGGGHSTMEVITPPPSLDPPWKISPCCVGYLAAYNSLIDGIFLFKLCYKMSFSSISVFKWPCNTQYCPILLSWWNQAASPLSLVPPP